MRLFSAASASLTASLRPAKAPARKRSSGALAARGSRGQGPAVFGRVDAADGGGRSPAGAAPRIGSAGRSDVDVVVGRGGRPSSRKLRATLRSTGV